MISQTLNDTITKVGPNTQAGAVLRYYWQPAALTDEVAGEFPVAVNLMGERLALVQSDDGTITLKARKAAPDEPAAHCPTSGEIVIDEVGPTYPTHETKGVIFAFLGPGTPPAFPNFDCFRAPDTHVFAFKGLWKCNWLQALEIGIDPAHASFLHRFLEDDDPEDSYGKQFRDKAAHTDMPMTRIPTPRHQSR
jgi:phenylpropionate dioxygenase-like ring-hydroxylating dioxygenase large terminal subunit